MGVDFYACDCCGESLYEEYVGHCSSCGHRIGTCCVVNDDINSRFAYHYEVRFDGSQEMVEEYGLDEHIENGWINVGDVIDDVGIDPKYCPFCQGTEVAKEDVLEYLLEKYGLDYEEVKREYLANKTRKE
jgi:hypothetical protein